MKITKYLHSCVLLEESDKTYLFDPGNYTANANVLDLDTLEKLDYLLITHEHQDHMETPLIKKILDKFPYLTIIANSSIQAILEKEGVKVSTEESDLIKIELVPHERMFDSEPPQNTLFTIGGVFAHSGDSHHFTTQAKVLALPVQAPWGSLSDAVRLALEIKPEIIVPIHDFHWKDEVRQSIYKRLEGFFAKHDIKFIPLETAQPVEV